MFRRAVAVRMLGAFLPVGLLAAGALPVASVSSATAPASTAEVTTVATKATYPTRWKCNDNEICTRLTGRKASRFVASWSGAVENKTSRRINDAQCKSTTSRTNTWGVSTSLSAELKAGIFASVNATIEGSVSKSMTSEIEFSVPFDVPPHTTTACTQGFKVFRWKAQRWDRVRSSLDSFTVRAPRTVVWRIKDVN